jgi:hypothetical protein
VKLTFQTIGRTVAIMTIITVFAASMAFFLWWVPKKQVASLQAQAANATNGKDFFEAEKDIFIAENSAHATLAQILGGFAFSDWRVLRLEEHHCYHRGTSHRAFLQSNRTARCHRR